MHSNGTGNPEQALEWRSKLAAWTGGFLLFELLTGFSIWLLPFSVPNQMMVLGHTLVGLVFLIPCSYYLGRHWWIYRRKLLTHLKFLGYLGTLSLLICFASGLVLTFENQLRLGYRSHPEHARSPHLCPSAHCLGIEELSGIQGREDADRGSPDV